MRPFEVRVEHSLLELWIADSPAELVRQHSALSCGINHYLGVETLTRAVAHLNFDADGLITLEKHLSDSYTLMNCRALLSGVFDQHLIKHRAGDLPGHGALMVYSFEEVKGTRLFPHLVRKLNTVLADEGTLFELLEEAHALERPIGVGHQRFTDVMARKHFFFEKDDAAAFALEYAGNGAAGRTPAHHDNVIGICSHAYRTVLSSGSKNSKRK